MLRAFVGAMRHAMRPRWIRADVPHHAPDTADDSIQARQKCSAHEEAVQPAPQVLRRYKTVHDDAAPICMKMAGLLLDR